MGESVTCPGCGESFSRIGNHWSRSSSCSHPRLSPEQSEIVTGLLCAGAQFEDVHRSDSYADTTRLRITSVNKDLITWVRDQFPVIATDLRVKTTAEESQEALLQRFRIDYDELDTSDLYQFSTRKLSQFVDMRLDWYGTYDSGSATVPDSLRITPLILKVLYAFRGVFTDYQSTSPGAAFSVNGLRGSAEFWEEQLDRFAPVTRRSENQILFLQDSRAFFNYLQSDPLTQDEPLPGTKYKWPEDISSVRTLGGRRERCPQCGKIFDNLGIHWGSSACSPPELSPELREFIEGMFMVGGTIQKVNNSELHLLRFETTDGHLAEWIANRLGPTASAVHDDSGRVLDIEGEKSSRITFDEYYFINTRPHPTFSEFTEWYGEPHGRKIPSEVIEPTPERLRGMLVHKGRIDSEGNPYIDIARQAVTNSDAKYLLEKFDPSITSYTGVQRVYINNKNAFKDYIGEPYPEASDNRFDWIHGHEKGLGEIYFY